MHSEDLTESDYTYTCAHTYPKSEVAYVTVLTMKAYRGRNGTAPLIRGLGARWT